jgi:hypothetical protein
MATRTLKLKDLKNEEARRSFRSWQLLLSKNKYPSKEEGPRMRPNVPVVEHKNPWNNDGDVKRMQIFLEDKDLLLC